MTSHLDDSYDVTNDFCCFEKFLANALFLPSFIAVRWQMAKLDIGEGAPPTKRGLTWTPKSACNLQIQQLKYKSEVVMVPISQLYTYNPV